MADASMTIMNGLLKGLVTKFDVVSSNTKDTAVEVSTLGDNLIDAIMDSSESISKKAAVVQKKSDAKIIESNNSKEQAEKDNVNITSANNELQDLKSEKQNGLLEAIRDKTSMSGQASSDLKSSIKSDFNSLTAPLQMIATTPGLKTIIQLLKTLSAFFFTAFKNMILDRFAKQITAGATGKDGKIDRKKQMQNVQDKFMPNFLRTDDQKKRRAKVMGTAIPDKPELKKMGTVIPTKGKLVKPDLKKMGEAMTGKQRRAELGTKVDGTADKRLAKNRSFLKKGQLAGGSAMRSIGKVFMLMRGFLLPIAIGITTAVTGFVTAIGSVIAAIGAIPLLIIGLVALIAVGLFFLGKYLKDNWDAVTEKFNLGVEQLGIFGTITGNFLKNAGKSLGFAVRGLWGSIMRGLQMAINGVIDVVNKLIPDWTGKDIEKVSFADNMAATLEADMAAFETVKSTQSEDIASRQKDLDDRRAVLNTPAAGDTSVTSVATTVNKTDTTQIIPASTTPTDLEADAAAKIIQ